MLTKSTTSQVIQEPFSRQLAPCCTRNICQHYLTMTTLDSCLTVSAIIALKKLSNATIRRDFDGQDRQAPVCPDENRGLSSCLSDFLPTTANEITTFVSKSASKSCKLDQIPTHLLKDNIFTLAPVIAEIVNLSITTGVFPSAFNKALVFPLLKKATLDPNNCKNYRSVSGSC